MIWMFIAAIVVGMLGGLALRAPAVVVLSGILGVAAFGYIAISGYSILGAVVIAFGLAAAVQLGFFAGVLLSAIFPERWWTRIFCRKRCGAAVYTFAYASTFWSLHG